jgi:hypothetical protein
MRKSIIIPIMVLILFCSPINIAAEDNSPSFKINDEFKPRKPKIKEKTFILDCDKHDINNDGIDDDVLLIGHKKDGVTSGFSEDIRIAIYDGNNKKYSLYGIGDLNSGYGGRIFLGDFNGDGSKDILVITHNQGSAGTSNYSLMTYKKGKVHHLFEQKDFSKGLSFEVDYIDGFKANLFSKDLNRFFTIDLNSRKYTYVDTGIYNKEGRLIEETKGEVGSLSELLPVDIDKDGIYELKGMQRVIGICNTDTIGYIKSTWKFENSRLKLSAVEFVPCAKPGGHQKIQRVMPVFSR